MPLTSLYAEQIAEQQLLAALRLWNAEEYVSAITLAGAAEEILGKRLRACGREPSFDNMKNAVIRLSEKLGANDPQTERIVTELMNLTRNELKHYAGDEALEFDLYEDSIELLERAITNYTLLTGVLHDEMIIFWGKIDGT